MIFLNETVTPANDATQKDWSLSTTAAAKDYARSFQAIVVPQSDFSEITVTIGGKDYTYTHSGEIKLESGKYTTVNLTVGRDRIELGDVTVNYWQQGEVINGGEAD